MIVDNDVRTVDNDVIAAKSHFWQWQRAELGWEGVTVTITSSTVKALHFISQFKTYNLSLVQLVAMYLA